MNGKTDKVICQWHFAFKKNLPDEEDDAEESATHVD